MNAIRYQLDGMGYRKSKTAPKIVAGCPNDECRGYELTGALNFSDDASYSMETNRTTWTTGEGWQPIGDSFVNALNTLFEGNGYTISNLMINRNGTDRIGLFGYIGREAKIANVGLLDIDIMGNDVVGGLVGSNGGTIIKIRRQIAFY